MRSISWAVTAIALVTALQVQRPSRVTTAARAHIAKVAAADARCSCGGGSTSGSETRARYDDSSPMVR